MTSSQQPNGNVAKQTCRTCSGAGYAPTRFGKKQLCHVCRGTGSVADRETVRPGVVPATGPTVAQMEELIVATDRFLEAFREGRSEEEVRRVEQRCADFIEKTRLAIDSNMPQLFEPLAMAHQKILGLAGQAAPQPAIVAG